MEQSIKRKIAIGTVAALALGGGGLAVAATQSTSRADKEKAFLEDAAKRLNVTPDQLSAALKGAFGDQLDEAVKAGRLTQKQADAMKERIAKGGLPIGPLGGPGGKDGKGGHGGPGGPGGRGFGGHGPFGAGLEAAASYLGLTEAQLREKLDDGKTSLADVAKAQGKTAAGLEQAIVDATRKQLAEAVKDGDLTQKQADRIEQGVTDHVDELVERTRPQPGERGPGGPGGPGGRP